MNCEDNQKDGQADPFPFTSFGNITPRRSVRKTIIRRAHAAPRVSLAALSSRVRSENYSTIFQQRAAAFRAPRACKAPATHKFSTAMRSAAHEHVARRHRREIQTRVQPPRGRVPFVHHERQPPAPPQPRTGQRTAQQQLADAATAKRSRHTHVHHFQQRIAVALQLLCADAGDGRELVDAGRLQGGDGGERAVVEDHVGRDGLLAGPGEAPGLFALESALDELAYELGMDPIELRLRNFAERVDRDPSVLVRGR